jgi:hypothetical protein
MKSKSYSKTTYCFHDQNVLKIILIFIHLTANGKNIGLIFAPILYKLSILAYNLKRNSIFSSEAGNEKMVIVLCGNFFDEWDEWNNNGFRSSVSSARH